MDDTLLPRSLKALELARKAMNQWLDGDASRTTQPFFVLGCQRSGTTMLIDLMRRSPSVWVHPEKNPLAYDDYRLRSPATIDGIVWATPADVAVFKPLCDAHLADNILDAHPGAKGVWIVRRWREVARSAVRKWGDHQLQVIRDIAAGRAEAQGWRGERIPEVLREQLATLVTDDLSPHAGAALFWYVRNSFFHALGLDADPRVLLVRYEDLLDTPDLEARRVFAHAGAAYLTSWTADIAPPGPAAALDDVPPEVAALCDALQARFDETRTA